MNRPRVLVIDNEPGVQELVKVNLTASGYEVLVTGDGETGLKLARSKRPGLILLDLRMPGMSGWDVLKALKADSQLHNIPVIVVTASLQTNQEERALHEGATAYMTKPFAVKELLSQVKKAIGG